MKWKSGNLRALADIIYLNHSLGTPVPHWIDRSRPDGGACVEVASALVVEIRSL